MIVGYVHVCQKGDWIRSLRMLMDVIRSSGLYENTYIIRIGIVNDEGKIVDNDILNDDKFEIHYFGKSSTYERCIVDWINLMLYWNIEKWHIAVAILNTHDTYGCNDVGHHYSGNFWWAKKSHIMSLPNYIGDNYTDPETWIQIIRNNKFCIYNSGYQGNGHYYTLFPRERYCKK